MLHAARCTLHAEKLDRRTSTEAPVTERISGPPALAPPVVWAAKD
jgi:hypothetical protein